MKQQTSEQLAARRREAANLAHPNLAQSGWTQAAIAKQLQVPQGTVCVPQRYGMIGVQPPEAPPPQKAERPSSVERDGQEFRSSSPAAVEQAADEGLSERSPHVVARWCAERSVWRNMAQHSASQ